MSTADEFLDAAATLIEYGTHAGHWRRAVSTAYYAGFHCLIDAACPIVFVDGTVQSRAKRWFEHSAMGAVARSVGSAPQDRSNLATVQNWVDTAGRKYGFDAPPSTEVATMCQLFAQLQERRLAADYFDTAGEAEVGEARDALAKARQLCALAKGCVAAPDCDRDFALVAAAMLHESVRPRRDR
jgi:hypothetical protein